MRILNWNTQIASPRGVNGRFEVVQEIVATIDADIICLTEAYPETMPSGGHIVTSGLSGWGRHERLGARKVVLWSKYPWRDIDQLGSERLPEGRFVRATTEVNKTPVTVVGMCIPYHSYRYDKSWAEKRKSIWQGASEYLDALREEILSQDRYRQRTMLIGDYNLQIPPSTYPYPSSAINRNREDTFAGWQIPTAVDTDATGLDKPLVDHIALSPDFFVRFVSVINRFGTHILQLSDHNGVVIDVAPV